ncbi:hypothetical protein [Methylobacter tundripaludum]|jgi:hypothetical protein|uniref:Uncharacterized protein n=1 Tax=Methylobacter tundripaludum (strain ATCC BAA-1195 / DSM 17260 / SV96) TaxID=697282 RepID=G3IR56_METTV|nr:hypothetical protein [Methylobacter tundripaludum]EGW23703.1 hypothetical protein Mettu_2565 [Methylobacter tundripaludum SV96]
MNKNDDVNVLSEDELELERFAKQGNKLKWTWIIGTLVMIICIMYGDAAQWLLVVFIAIYIFITTANYLRSISSKNS